MTFHFPTSANHMDFKELPCDSESIWVADNLLNRFVFSGKYQQNLNKLSKIEAIINLESFVEGECNEAPPVNTLHLYSHRFVGPDYRMWKA